MNWKSSQCNSTTEGVPLDCLANYQTVEEFVPHDQRVAIVIYWMLIILGAGGNLSVLISRVRKYRQCTRADLLIAHLAVADVLVTCGVIPLEIWWKYTNGWLPGNVFCKLLLVMRAFSLFLSSNVLVCISLDRFFAVLYPLKLVSARKRSKNMLYCAWVWALACSLPQSAVFRVSKHPNVSGFEQCVSFRAFANATQEVAYNVWCLCAMYFLPLLVITVCYVCIFCKILHYGTGLGGGMHGVAINVMGVSVGGSRPCGSGVQSSIRLRRSNHQLFERARRRLLLMTSTIVTMFTFCWLPYAVMTMWCTIDQKFASRVSPQVQDLLFALAVATSCLNPLVHGSYVLLCNDTFQKAKKITKCWRNHSINTTGNIGVTSRREMCHINNPPAISMRSNPRTRPGVRYAETTLASPQQALAPRARRGSAQLLCMAHERQRALHVCRNVRSHSCSF